MNTLVPNPLPQQPNLCQLKFGLKENHLPVRTDHCKLVVLNPIYKLASEEPEPVPVFSTDIMHSFS